MLEASKTIGSVHMPSLKNREKLIWCALFALMLLAGRAAGETYRGRTVLTDAPAGAGQKTPGWEEELPPKVALTFDDGPHPVYTKELLEGLKERGVKATFFVVGENIPGREELIRRMWEEGHLIGNHTYDHEDISKMTTEKAQQELWETSSLVKDITGEETAYVRAPFGNWDEKLDGSVTMLPVKWTVDPLDWTTGNVDQIVGKVVDGIRDNDIILLHDYYESSIQAALQIVDILKEQGYEFVTVEELLLE